MTSRSTLRDRLFVAVTALIVLIPLIATIFGSNRILDEREQRRLAPWPTVELSVAGLRGLAPALEHWFDDHFGFRDKLVRLHDLLEFKLLGTSRRVLVGKDGWLFLERGIRTDVEMIPIVRDLCGEVPFSDRELNFWTNALDENRRRLEQKGIQYILTIVPNKHTLYRQYLRHASDCDYKHTRLNQLSARLKEIPNFRFVPLLPALQRVTQDGTPVYHMTDTHWNGPGIRAAYAELATVLDTATDWINVEANGRVKPNRVHNRAGDLSRMAGLEDVVTESMLGFTVHQPIAEQQPNPWPKASLDPHRQPEEWKLPESSVSSDVVIYHDSFVGRTVKTLFAESFARVRFVWQGSPMLDIDMLNDDPPQLVIHEMVERNLLQPW